MNTMIDKAYKERTERLKEELRVKYKQLKVPEGCRLSHTLPGYFAGELNPRALITDELALLICQDLSDSLDLSFKEIGEGYGVSRETVRNIYRRLTWKHISSPFHFPERSMESWTRARKGK